MDTLFENIQLYCSILRKCSSIEVGKWQEEDLDRAFHWADYFDKALIRIDKRKSVVAKVDQYLKELGEREGWKLGEKTLNYEFFKQSSKYLIETLVDNSCLSTQLREKILGRVDQLSSPAVSSPLPLPCDAISLLACVQQAQMDGTKDSVYKHLDSLLLNEGALDLLLKSLVETERNYGDTQKLILHWLLGKVNDSKCGRQLSNVWDHSPSLLAKISSQYLSFFKEHIKYLIRETERLETLGANTTIGLLSNVGISNIDSSQAATKVAVNIDSYAGSLKKIANHFVALSMTNDEVRDICVSFVRSRAHKVGGRFCYSSILSTCPWIKLLASIVYSHHMPL